MLQTMNRHGTPRPSLSGDASLMSRNESVKRSQDGAAIDLTLGPVQGSAGETANEQQMLPWQQQWWASLKSVF